MADSAMAWSVLVVDAVTGEQLIATNPEPVLRTASIGKLLLLIEVARRLSIGDLDSAEQLTRTSADAVADSGVWQHLSVETLPVSDLAQLIGMASDNLATNVLLRRVGVGAVANTATELGLLGTALLDQVRDQRGPTHPWTLSTGSAAELAGLLARLWRRELVSAGVSEQVLGWLAHGLDLSMVAAGWGLDPLSHSPADPDLRLFHKTGTDDGVRADVGVLAGADRVVAYAALANWDPSGVDHTPAMLSRMRTLGLELRRLVSGPDRFSVAPSGGE